MTLSLDTRQRAMLAAMGVRVWQPNAAVEPLVQPDTTMRAEPPVVPVVRPVARVAQAAAAPAPAAVALKALPEGFAEMDWAALQNAASLCQACGLCETRQRSGREPVKAFFAYMTMAWVVVLWVVVIALVT